MLCVLPSWWQLSCPLSFTFKSQLEHQSPWTICSDNCLLFPLVLLITMYCNHPFTFITVSTDLGVLLVAQWVKHLPAMWETWVWFSGWEVPQEKEMAIHSGTLAWKIPWMEEPGSHHPWGCKELNTTEQLHSLTITQGRDLEQGVPQNHLEEPTLSSPWSLASWTGRWSITVA